MAQLEHFHKSDRRRLALASLTDSSLGDDARYADNNDLALDDEDEYDELDAASYAAAPKRRRGSHSSPLLRRLGTPARCGSFATSIKPNMTLPSPLTPTAPSITACSPTKDSQHKVTSGSKSEHRNTGNNASSGRQESTSGRLDDAQLEALLRRCEGSGAPGFAFDVEAFRGALRAVESRENGRRQ